jgi:hypothetical protein
MISPTYLAKLIEQYQAREAERSATVTSLHSSRTSDEPVVRAA